MSTAIDEQELWRRLGATEQLPRGRGQIAALESVLNAAEAHGSPALRYAVRIHLIAAYQQGGEPAKAFVPFAWCLAVHDRGEADPGWNHSLHWYFKFMAGSMANFPEVPLDRTREALDDMERRYRAAGYSMNPVHQYRAMHARHVGDRETAAEQYRLWSAAPRGEMSDCVGCEPSDKVRHLTWLGQYAEAVDAAEPVLGGTFTCTQQPHDILTSLLLPYVHIGRYADAARAHRQAYRAIRHDPAQLGEVATHVRFCALTGNHARGLDLVERHLSWLPSAPSPFSEMEFAAAGALTLRLVAEAGHGDQPVGGTTVAALRDELAERALALVARFDARNGTSEQGDQIRAILAEKPLVEHLPLSGEVASPPVPAVPALPETPAELAELAETEAWLGRPAAEIWARFDRLCPEPSGELLARRLAASADDAATTDPAGAARDFARAAELFAAAGDPAAAETARGKEILLLALTGDRPGAAGELEASANRLADPADRCRALLRLSYFHFARQDLEAAQEILDRIGPLASGLPEVAGTWLERRALVLANRGDLPGALNLATESAARYAEVGAAGHAAKVRLLGAQLSAALGDKETAFAETAAIDLGADRGRRAHLGRLRGHLAMDLGRPAEAVAAFRAAVADFAATDHPLEAAALRIELAFGYLSLGRPEDAAEAAEDAEPVLERAGAGQELARCRYALAQAYRELDRPQQAVELLGVVAEYFAEAGDAPAAGEATAVRADILDSLDRDADAAAGYAKAAEHFHAAELTADELRARRRTALSWLWAGERDRAEQALAAADAVTEVEGPQFAWEKAMTSYDGARLLANLERPQEALVRAEAAAEALRAQGEAGAAVAAEVLCGRLLRDLGRPGEARQVLAAALARLPEDAGRQRAEVEALLEELPN